MIVSEGYSIEQFPKQNQIVIKLPQTYLTATNTVSSIENRRTVLSENELVSILSLTKAYYQIEGVKEQKQ